MLLPQADDEAWLLDELNVLVEVDKLDSVELTDCWLELTDDALARDEALALEEFETRELARDELDALELVLEELDKLLESGTLRELLLMEEFCAEEELMARLELTRELLAWLAIARLLEDRGGADSPLSWASPPHALTNNTQSPESTSKRLMGKLLENMG